MSQAAMNGPKNGPPSRQNTQRFVYRTRSWKKNLQRVSTGRNLIFNLSTHRSCTMLNPMTCGAVFTKPCNVRKAVKDP